MTPGIEYALGALVLFGLGDLVYKRGAAAGAQPHHFLMVQSWVFAPSVVLYAMWTGSLHFVAGSLWGALTGFFILIGLFTRPIALLLSGEMAVAYWMVHAPKSIYPTLNGGDAAILYCFIFLYLAAAGAGAFSVDGASSRSA